MSTERSTKYYKTPEGKRKKKHLNCKLKNTALGADLTETKEKKLDQKKIHPSEDTRTVTSPDTSPEKEIQAKPVETEVTKVANIKFNDEIVEYVQVAISLIEVRSVSLTETLKILNRIFRQHSIGQEKRIDYIVGYLKKNPP